MGIKIIHQIWLQGEEELPDKYKPFLKSYRGMKGYKHMLWNDISIRNLIQKTFPELMEVYDYYPFWVMRVDLAKYIILYEYGGFYVDMDTEPLQTFDTLIEVSREKPIVTYYDIHENPKYRMFSRVLRYILNNNFMYSPSVHHPLYHLLSTKSVCTHKRQLHDYKMYYILGSIGPIYVYDIVNEYDPKGTKVHHLHLNDLKKYVHDYAANSWCNPNSFFIDMDTRDKIVTVIAVIVIIYILYSLWWMSKRTRLY